MAPISTDAVMDLLRQVAAEVISPRFRALADGEVTEKNPGDLVTIADHEAEDAITARLRMAYPQAVVLGEEAYATRPELLVAYQQADHAFTVDPLDGTKNFVNGSPDHAVMVAEVRSGTVVRGWIWLPEHGVGWSAERGAGAERNGVPATVTPAPDPDRAQGLVSFREMVGQSLDGLAPLQLTRLCSGADYAALVDGEVDYVVNRRGEIWDHAPGSLILTEAGGRVGFADGDVYDPRERRPGPIAAIDRPLFERVRGALAGSEFADRGSSVTG